MKDCHVHTTLSHDGKSSIEEYLNIAEEKNVDEITFTEHYDIYDGVETKLTTPDVDKNKEEYLKRKDDSKVKTNFGIEIGLRPESFPKIRNMVISHDFDQIGASIHILKGIDISKTPKYFEERTIKEAYIEYLDEEIECANKYYYEFDTFCHLDHIVRYGSNTPQKIDLNDDDYRDRIDTILRILIRKDKGLEINTSGFRYGVGQPHPCFDIIKRNKELGGKIITVGSDAHQAKDLASHFEIVYQMLETVGYDEVAIYHHRKPDFVKIKSLY